MFIGKWLLVGFLIVFVCADGFVKDKQSSLLMPKEHMHPEKDKLIGKDLKPLKADETPDGPFCQKIIAYYVGTFESLNFPTSVKFDAQFQLTLEANEQSERIKIKVDEWSEEFGNSTDYELDFYYETSNQWCDINQEDCTSSFTKSITTFQLDLTRKEDGEFFHLLYFDYFNNSFYLENPRGMCSKHPLDDIDDDWLPDLKQLSVCLCCDSYDPAVLLGCPENPWQQKETTCKVPPTEAPKTTVTHEPTTTKYEPPRPQDLTCSNVVAYYTGVFENSLTSGGSMPVEFQTRLISDKNQQQILYQIDQWNEEKTKLKDVSFYAYDTQNSYTRCAPPHKCSHPFTSDPNGEFFLDLDHTVSGTRKNEYDFMYFPNFDNQFVLHDAVGQCTNRQPSRPSDFSPDSSKFEYCICCNSYSPDPSLGCPANKWA